MTQGKRLAVLIYLSRWGWPGSQSAIIRLVDDQQTKALRTMRRALVFFAQTDL